MASTAQRANYARKAQRVIEKLKAKGRPATFGRRTQTGDERSPNVAFELIAVNDAFQLTNKTSHKADEEMDEVSYIASAENDISGASLMIDDGKEYTIDEIIEFKPDDQVIFYEVFAHG